MFPTKALLVQSLYSVLLKRRLIQFFLYSFVAVFIQFFFVFVVWEVLISVVISPCDFIYAISFYVEEHICLSFDQLEQINHYQVNSAFHWLHSFLQLHSSTKKYPTFFLWSRYPKKGKKVFQKETISNFNCP